MRLFLGFLPTAAERQVYSASQRLQRADELPLKWVPPENWHVTVAFLGEVDEKALVHLDAAIAPVVAGATPFSFSFSEMAWFPSIFKPRLLTLMVEPDATLSALQREVVSALRREGFHTENREYRPHLTLARLKGARRRFQPPALPPIPAFSCEAQELVLFESITGGPASVYRPLQSFELAA